MSEQLTSAGADSVPSTDAAHDGDHADAQQIRLQRMEHTGGGFTGTRLGRGMSVPAGATNRPCVVPPPGRAPSRAQRRLLERMLREGRGSPAHRAEAARILAGGC